jgi:glutaredoxin
MEDAGKQTSVWEKMRSVHLVLYTKANCPLCDEARAALEQAGLRYEERDILADPALFARYRYRIPVLAADGRDVQEGHFDPAVLRRLRRKE